MSIAFLCYRTSLAITHPSTPLLMKADLLGFFSFTIFDLNEADPQKVSKNLRTFRVSPCESGSESQLEVVYQWHSS